ncbi:hypothetical protein RU97_GL002662 [Enterococcus canis]|uniref:Uncharacterized protein n=1 Tax=Enterococcus canis TaxID=214095 RepID=A0A1L8RCK1_9ENTE|nr:cell wall-active antibiotics response protein LiaF [Enterococcus canis]OJG17491.1 hypothetical protein RU97_GL002662 [Enterococcus canis]
MNNPWRFFIIIESLLAIFGLWQLIHNPPLLIILVFGVMNLLYVAKKVHRTSFNQFQFILGLIAILVGLLSSPAVWAMIVFAVLFVGLKGVEVSGVPLFEHAPWNRKKMVMVETTNHSPKGGKRYKRPWFANERIGTNIYEWDDININLLSGDTIIDLGNTLLPKQDSVIMIRKGFGRTRVLVPTGVAISLEHSTFLGSVGFDDERYQLRNESLRLYSNDYDTNPRRLRLVTNALIGDLEVIRV